MNIIFTKEELTAIAHNDYSIFDHELSAYELKEAIRQIVAELTSSEPIRKLQDEISSLKGELEIRDSRIHMAELLLDGRLVQIKDLQKENKCLEKQVEELKKTIHYRELALDQAAAKRDELETKNRQLCNDLAGERLTVRNLEEKLAHWIKKYQIETTPPFDDL